MVVPLSAREMRRKVDAIQRHQSQKDRPLFPGADSREFWQRALARNEARPLRTMGSRGRVYGDKIAHPRIKGNCPGNGWPCMHETSGRERMP